jgi:hypothetical protein
MDPKEPGKRSALNEPLPSTVSCPADAEDCFELAYEADEFGVNPCGPASGN